MKNQSMNVFLIVLVVVLIVIGWFGVSQRTNVSDGSSAANGLTGKLTVDEAEKLVLAYLLKEKPEVTVRSTDEYPLIETTTDEIWQKINAQTFKVNGEFENGQDYIIEDGKVTALGNYWGGGGIGGMSVQTGDERLSFANSIQIEDIDGDGQYEMAFVYVTGSGISQFMNGIYFGPGQVEVFPMDNESNN